MSRDKMLGGPKLASFRTKLASVAMTNQSSDSLLLALHGNNQMHGGTQTGPANLLLAQQSNHLNRSHVMRKWWTGISLHFLGVFRSYLCSGLSGNLGGLAAQALTIPLASMAASAT